MQRRRLWPETGEVDDGRGCGIRLLRADAALFDGQVCRIAGGKDPPAGSCHSTVLVDVQESVDGVACDASDVGPCDARHGDDQIRAQVTTGCMQQWSILLPNLGPGVYAYPRVRQQFGDGFAGLAAEGG